MKKEAYYFPHFSNARHDRKIRRLIKDLGIEGYGIYFMLLEILREQMDLRYPFADIDLLADEIGTSDSKVKVVVSNYDLFVLDNNGFFFSLKQIEYLKPYFAKIERGKELAQRRWNAPIEQTEKVLDSNLSSNAMPIDIQRKEKKEKEKKEEEILVGRDLIWHKWFEYLQADGTSLNPITKKTIKGKFSLVDDDMLIAIIDQSIERGWKSLYPLKENTKSSFSKPSEVRVSEIKIPDNY